MPKNTRVKTDMVGKVREVIDAHPDGLSLQQIADEMGESASQTSKRLYNLVVTKRAVQHPPDAPRGESMFYPAGHGPAAQGIDVTPKNVAPAGGGADTPAATPAAPASAATSAAPQVEKTPLSGDREKFEQILDNLGVKAGPTRTIAETFFETGDHDDLSHLWNILYNARAFVTNGQRRTIMMVWASYVERDMPHDIAKLLEEARAGEAGEGDDKAETLGIDDFGLGWRVEKDETGEWVPVAGGEIKTHMQALRAAAAMNAASGKGKRAESDGGGRGIDPTVQVLIDRAFPDDRAGDSKQTLDQVLAIVDRIVPQKREAEGEEGEVARLRRELQEEREKARDKEMGELRGLVGVAVNRDPVEEFIRMQERMNLIRGSPVTDGSPTVQVIKDQTDKLERLGARGLGLVERMALRNQPLEPEEGSEVDQEQRAEGLANRLEGDTRQRQLRREVYGV